MLKPDPLFLGRLHNELPKFLEKVVPDPGFRSLFVRALSGGKKIRPLCLAWVFETLSGRSAVSSESCVRVSCALEMIHAYSLIHDDLPAMDNDDFRRGQPTLHRITSEGEAIIVGDALLTAAFEIVAFLPNSGPIVYELARAAGGSGMVWGQWRDIRENFETLPQVENIHALKTGALFGAAASIGALLSREFRALNSQDMQTLRTWGVELGILFQWIDDLLDDEIPSFFSSKEELENHCKEKIKKLRTLEGPLELSDSQADAFYGTFMNRRV